MKKSIKTIGTIVTVGIMLGCAFWSGNVATKLNIEAQAVTPQETHYPEKRVMTGKYYDYMVVETTDGNEWLLDDTDDSPYIENGAAVFEGGEPVQIVFDTEGTESLKDDVIVEVRSIDKRYK